MNLGRDIDIAFLAIGSRLDRVTRGRDGEGDRLHMRSQLNEVVRVRITPSGGASMAMEMIRNLIVAGIADKSGILVAIEEIDEPQFESDDEVSETADNESEGSDEA